MHFDRSRPRRDCKLDRTGHLERPLERALGRKKGGGHQGNYERRLQKVCLHFHSQPQLISISPEPARSSTSTPPPRTLPRMEPCPTVPVTVTGKPVEISPELVWASSSNPRSEGKCTRIWPAPVTTRHSPVGLPSAVMSPAPVRSSSVP